jgi:DNA invertase Pin-like site-specific DNA recombinase
VSTLDQDLSGQIEALKASGATMIYREKISGVRAVRPQSAKLMAALKLFATVPGAIAEFERDLIRERTTADRERAKANGVRFGRKPKLSDYQRAAALKRRSRDEVLRILDKNASLAAS